VAVLRVAALIIGGIGLSGLYVLVYFYPAFPKSIAGWLAVFFLAFPFLAALEWVGGVVFGPKSLANLPSPIRISAGVLMLLALLAATLPLYAVISGLINS
jgi:hypothetical protein